MNRTLTNRGRVDPSEIEAQRSGPRLSGATLTSPPIRPEERRGHNKISANLAEVDEGGPWPDRVVSGA